MKNPGKVFEEDFAASVPSDCMLHRLKDSAQSYNNSRGTLFAWDNPFDYFLFDGNSGLLYCLELKSTKAKSMSYQTDKDDNSSRMIKLHQIDSLKKYSSYKNVVAYFVFNFRDEKNNMQRTYFMDIDDFCKMTNNVNKHSVNEMDMILYGAKKIVGSLKRTRYRWDVGSFLDSVSDKIDNK